MVVPEAPNDRTSSKTQMSGPVQDSGLTVGPRFIGASPVWGAPIKGSAAWRSPLIICLKRPSLSSLQSVMHVVERTKMFRKREQDEWSM